MKRLPLAAAIVLATITPAFSADSNAGLESLRAEIRAQQARLDAQQKQIEALAAQQESAPSAASDTTVGGYGEVHFNHRDGDDPAVGRNNIHAHRVVLMVAHRFADDLRFFSEVEFEGAPDSTGIETEVEQFGIAWQVQEKLQLTIGQFLVPVGLLNETHEPETFYGVERNPVEEFVIPATWWEKGVLASWRATDGLSVEVALHNGLLGDVNTLGTADGLRGFRQEFGGARVEDAAATARVKFTGVNGLELGLALQRQENITQSGDPLTGGKAPAVLAEVHAVYSTGRFTLRALAAQWDIDNAVAAGNGTDALDGWYVEPSWKANEKVGVFTRYNRWNTAANVVGVQDEEQTNVGMNWWIAPRVVLKVDVQDSNRAGGLGDGFNLGMGLGF